MATQKDFIVKNGLDVGGDVEAAGSGSFVGLDVTGNVVLGGTVNPQITLNDTSTSNLIHTITSGSDKLQISTDPNQVHASSRIEFLVDAAERVQITNVGMDVSGNLTASGNLEVAGNLTVNGTSTTLNVATLDVEDKNITLNFGAGDTSASAGGAGITIQDAVDASNDASILWDATDDKFDFSHRVDVAGLITSTSLTVDGISNLNNHVKIANGYSLGWDDITTRITGNSSTDLIQIYTNAIKRLDVQADGDIAFYKTNGASPPVPVAGMHWDYADGKLGIGTNAPTAPLSLLDASLTTQGTGEGGLRVHRPNAASQYGYFDYTYNGGGVNIGSLYSAGGAASFGTFTFRQHSSTTSQVPMFINGTGNVGIGTDAPITALHVEDDNDNSWSATTDWTVQTSDSLALVNTSNSDADQITSLYMRASGNGGNVSARQVLRNIGGGAGEIHWQMRDAAHTTTTNDKMILKSSGELGIGISPSSKLTVFGTGAGNATVQIEGEGGADPYINFLANNTQHWSLGIDDSDADKFKLSEHSALGTNDYFVVDVTGNVGIGITDPATSLHVDAQNGTTYPTLGTAGGSLGLSINELHGMYLGVDGPSGNGWVQAMREDGTGTAYNLILQPSGGNVGIGTDTPTAMLQVGNSVSGETGLVIFNSEGGNQSGLLVKSRTNRATLQVSDNDSNAFVQAEDSHAIYGQHSSLASADMTIDAPGNMNLQNGSYYVDQVRHSIRPSLNLDFANSKQLDSSITFYRDSIATYYDSNGLLKYANINEPRFDHDPLTGESKGLLIEEARANIAFNSAKLTGLTPTRCDVIPALAPDGTFSGFKLVEQTTATAVSRYVHTGTYTITAGTTYTVSAYIKANERTNLQFRLETGGVWSYHILNVDLATDTATSSLHNQTNGNYTITDVGNGWKHISASIVPVASSTNMHFTIMPVAGSNSYVGVAGSGLSFWGVQIEVGTFATSYIPPDTSFTSRASSATYRDETGIIRTAPAQIPRYGYEYDGRNWVETGLILEAASTNMLYHSTKGSDLYGDVLDAEAIWTITDSSTDVSAPDGGKFTTKGVSGTSGNSWYWKTSPFSYTNGTTYTHSAWIRTAAGTTGTVAINVYPQTGATGVTATDEWQRVSVTFVYNSGVGTPYIGFVGPQLSRTFYFWGWQIEAQTQPTSYISTLGSAVTRAADVVSSVAYTRGQDVANINDISWYNAKESTIYGEGTSISGNNDVGSSPCLWGITDGGSVNRYLLRRNGSGGSVALDRSGFTFRLCMSGFNNDYFPLYSVLPLWQDTEIHKMALSIKPNSQIAVADGIDGQMTSITIPEFDTPTMAQIGMAGSSTAWNGHIRKISYYATQLNLAELKALTENN